MRKYTIEPLYVDGNGDAWFAITCHGCGEPGEQKGYDPDPVLCWECGKRMFGKDVVDKLKEKGRLLIEFTDEEGQ